jgi:hypothetical protein
MRIAPSKPNRIVQYTSSNFKYVRTICILNSHVPIYSYNFDVIAFVGLLRCWGGNKPLH